MRGWSWVVVAVLMVLVVGGCGTGGPVVDVGAAPTRPEHAATSTAAPPDGSLAREFPGDAGGAGGSVDGDGGAAEPGGAVDPNAPGAPDGGTPTPDTTTLSLWFTQGEQIASLPRSVPRVPRIGSAVLEQLLAGPTSDERAAGYGTEIPASTRLRNLSITDGVAIVDLTGDFESGGGTLGLTLRLAQVVCTLDQFPTVDGVRFALDGQVVDVFSGDGLIIDEPVACSDYADQIAT